MGIVDKIQDKLSGNKHKEHDQTHGTSATGTHVGHEPGATHSATQTASHNGAGLTSNPNNTAPSSALAGDHTAGSGIGGAHNTSSGLTGNHQSTPGSGLTGSHHNTGSALTSGDDHTYSHAGHPQHADFIPGNHPAAQNPAAVPTAGGERVGSIPGGNGPYDDNHGTHGTHGTHGIHDNRGGMEKIKDKVIPSRTDRPDDPITGQNYGQNTTSGVSGHHGSSGLTGSHGTSAAAPLAYDSAFNDRHTGSGLTGNTHSASGLTGNTHSGSGLTGNTHTGSNLTSTSHAGQGSHLTGHNQYGAGGIDNRSGVEQIKDKAIPTRADRPDDPVTGQNYGQSSGTGNYATGGSHIPGTTHSGQGSHLAGNQTYGTGVGHTGPYDSSTGSTGLGGHSTTHGAPTTHGTTAAKPSLMDKLNPKKDADLDGKAGIMD